MSATKRNRIQEGIDALSADAFYRAVPIQNAGMRTVRAPGGPLLEVPLQKPRGFAAFLAWLAPLAAHQTIRLDELGAELLALCDGQHAMADIVALLAERYRLTRREARLSLEMFLKRLIQKGVIGIALKEEPCEVRR